MHYHNSNTQHSWTVKGWMYYNERCNVLRSRIKSVVPPRGQRLKHTGSRVGSVHFLHIFGLTFWWFSSTVWPTLRTCRGLQRLDRVFFYQDAQTQRSWEAVFWSQKTKWNWECHHLALAQEVERVVHLSEGQIWHDRAHYDPVMIIPAVIISLIRQKHKILIHYKTSVMAFTCWLQMRYRTSSCHSSFVSSRSGWHHFGSSGAWSDSCWGEASGPSSLSCTSCEQTRTQQRKLVTYEDSFVRLL